MFASESFIPFAQALYNHVGCAGETRNFFVSPLSVYSALSLVLGGSESESWKELVAALHIEEGGDAGRVCKWVGEELQAVSKGDSKKSLVQSNGVFVQMGSHILKTYSTMVTENFGAVLKELNFEKEPEAARAAINEWISEKTMRKIKKLLGEGSISPLTRLVLANAIYFKGSWKAKFDKALTNEEGVFHTLSKGDVKMSMMERKGRYPLADFVDLEVRALKIPFECHEMLIVLPEKKDGIGALVRTLSEKTESFKELLTSDQYFETEVILRMPKFSLDGGSVELRTPLEKMGVKSIFDCRHADFSGITGDRSLIVSGVHHQAVIEVDEEGAEAAAATGVVMMCRSMPMRPEEFFVDHPFVFFIISSTGIPVFMGHVVEPKTK